MAAIKKWVIGERRGRECLGDDIIKAIIVPINSIAGGSNFKERGSKGSGIILNMVQFIINPMVIAFNVRINMGEVIFHEVSLIYAEGLEFGAFQIRINIKRRE